MPGGAGGDDGVDVDVDSDDDGGGGETIISRRYRTVGNDCTEALTRPETAALLEGVRFRTHQGNPVAPL